MHMSCSKNGGLLVPFVSSAILGGVRSCSDHYVAYVSAAYLIHVYLLTMEALFRLSSHISFP